MRICDRLRQRPFARGGIERNAAERMIALGFFEPVIARFPTSVLRDEIRTALQAKLA